MAVRTFNGAVLVGDTGVVARRGHAVVGAHGIVASGQVVAGVTVEVAEGRRQAVAAMLGRNPAERPQGVLQALGQGHEALPAQNDMGMLPAGERQTEMIEPVFEGRAGDVDAQFHHVGEIGQALQTRGMLVTKDHLPLRPMDRPPRAHPAFERPSDGRSQFGMPAQDLLQHADRAQGRGRAEHRQDLAVPDSGERIGATTPARLPGL